MPIDSEKAARPRPSAVVIIPCLNEEQHIQKTIAHFIAEPASVVGKIIVVDGGSTDQTVQIVQQRAVDDERVVLVRNDRRIQSSGINRAVELFGDLAPFIIRIDAHADYPDNFCQTLLETQKQTGAESVVVSMITKGLSCFQKAAAAAQNSKMGNGGAAHRGVADGRYVDHGHHALMSVGAFRSVGGYDEAFSHNEDAELDLRLVAAGYRIYLCGSATIIYYPRRELSSLFDQYRKFGRGRAMTTLKHRVRPKLRQLLPILIGPVVALSSLFWLTPLLALPAAAWAGACLVYGAVLGIRAKDRCACAAGIAAMSMHLGFSVGFILQVAKQIAGRVSFRGTGPQLGTFG